MPDGHIAYRLFARFYALDPVLVMILAAVEARIALLQGRGKNLIGPRRQRAAIHVKQPLFSLEYAPAEAALSVEQLGHLLLAIRQHDSRVSRRAPPFDDHPVIVFIGKI